MIKWLALLFLLIPFVAHAQGPSKSYTTVAPGLSTGSSYNPGTQRLPEGSTLSPQLFYEAHTSSCSLNSTCGATDDTGKLLVATASGVIFTTPAAGVAGARGFQFGYDGSHSYTITSVAGTIYGGCGANGSPTSGATVSGINIDIVLVPDGTNWKCRPLANFNTAGSYTFGGQNTYLGSNAFLVCPLTYATTITVNMSACPTSTDSVGVQAVTLTGPNANVAFPTGMIPGSKTFVTLMFIQDNVGNRTVNPAAGYSPPFWPLSTRAGAIDAVTCLVDQAGAYASCGPVQHDIGGTTPTTLTGLGTLQLYANASDAATLFTGANCTGGLASGSGAAVGSIQAKGALSSCGNVTGTVTLQLDGNNQWYLAFGPNNYITWGSASAIYQNASYIVADAGVEYAATSTGGQPVFYVSTPTSTNARFECGLDYTTGLGLFIHARTLDADAGQSMGVSSGDTGVSGVLLAQNCNLQPALSDAWLNFNNGNYTADVGTFDGNGGTRAGQNTSNTASALVATGYDGAGNYFSTGSRVYYLAVWTNANATGISQQAIESWGCSKMGFNC